MSKHFETRIKKLEKNVNAKQKNVNAKQTINSFSELVRLILKEKNGVVVNWDEYEMGKDLKAVFEKIKKGSGEPNSY